jgi:hypothetical protein
MRNLFRTIIILLGIGLVSLFLVHPALAFPPLPSSFYGMVKINALNVPDGTIVKALVDGQVYAETKSLTYKGDSVYTLDVLGDDTSSPAIDGGHEGDTIVFMVGDQKASQTGTWRGGTNTNLDLSVGTSASANTPTPVKKAPASGAGTIIIVVVVVSIILIAVWRIFVYKPKS